MKQLVLLSLCAAGCAIGTPFEDGPAAETIAPTGQYIVSVTHLRFKAGMGDITFDHSDVLAEKIKASPGNVGHALRRQFVDRDIWTLSMWTDRESLGNFVASPEHLAAIRDVAPTAESGRTGNFMIDIVNAPPSWDRALEELERTALFDEQVLALSVALSFRMHHRLRRQPERLPCDNRGRGPVPRGPLFQLSWLRSGAGWPRAADRLGGDCRRR